MLAIGLAAPFARAQAPAPPDARRTLPYRIITNDRLGVHIFQEDDLSLRMARVDAKGKHQSQFGRKRPRFSAKP